MNFEWEPAQLQLRDSVREFAKRGLDVEVRDRDASGAFDRTLWSRAAEFGIQGLPVPEAYGGGGTGPVETMLAMEALGYRCRDHGFLFSLHAHMWAVEMPLLGFGSEELKRRYLPGLCDGSLIGAHAMSEPDTGSDAFALRTRAERRGDRHVLSENGETDENG